MRWSSSNPEFEIPPRFFTEQGAKPGHDVLIRPDTGLTSFRAHHGPAHSCPVAFRYHPALRRNALWKSATGGRMPSAHARLGPCSNSSSWLRLTMPDTAPPNGCNFFRHQPVGIWRENCSGAPVERALAVGGTIGAWGVREKPPRGGQRRKIPGSQ